MWRLKSNKSNNCHAICAVSLLAHKDRVVIIKRTPMVQKAASGQEEKPDKIGSVGQICANDTAGNGQMQGYRRLHPRAVKRMYIVSQDIISSHGSGLT